MKRSLKGFTLVELIVVMIILAILAAMIVPSMTGYIDKAKENAIIVEARGVYTASQAAVTEYYAFHPKYKTKFKLNGSSDNNCGRVTNNMLWYVQHRPQDVKDDPTKAVDYAIAIQVLKYLESEDYSTAMYKMETKTNALGAEIVDYQGKNKNQPAINICYNNKGKVVFVEYGRDGTVVRIEGSKVIVKENHKMTNEPT